MRILLSAPEGLVQSAINGNEDQVNKSYIEVKWESNFSVGSLRPSEGRRSSAGLVCANRV